ncbi:DEAD/DEAH box helicase family protein [Enterobacter mori]|nr:DEAD/DEAH box helicase family protein [Enterobacter bugandensis]RTN92192.1 DEAD/DEAH box helicase [Enterobacter bugandensis]
MLKNAALKYTYSSEDCSIVKDFYIPALKSASSYDRAVGFFSSSSLSIAARGLAPLLFNGGRMRLIIGYPVNPEDFEAIKIGVNIQKHFIDISEKTNDFLQNMIDTLECRRFDALSFLVASKRLEIRFAFRPRGMYHEKIGVIRDVNFDRVAFIGSANETENALNDDLNSESINSYFSWDESIYKHYGLDIEERFEKLWNDQQPITKTIPANTEFLNLLSDYHSGKEITAILKSLEDIENGKDDIDANTFDCLPELPKFIGKEKYKLRDHQKNALNNWVKNKYQGILKLATGAGKTITALHAGTVITLNDFFCRGLCIIVAVPYQGLAEQWHEEMKSFNIHSLLCYKAQSLWLQHLKNQVSEFNLSTKKTFLAIVVVNDTLKKQSFLNEINKINPERILFIGDECHNHANNKIIDILPKAKMRLGLSATPWNENELYKKTLLTSYYGEIISEYGLKEAIQDKVLCPYDYFPIPCKMNDEEADKYEDLSVKIAKLEAIKESGNTINEDALMHLYLKRSRILGSLASKLIKLESIIVEKGRQTHTLFYCGEGGIEGLDDNDEKNIDDVTKILHKCGWRTSKFTSEQSLSMRKKIMVTFKNGEIDALVSKRVLDEGIDVPACSQAYIMASTRNERQYIQRRGRVLRHSPNKQKAVIYDFVSIPPSHRTQACFLSLIQQEQHRIKEFSSLSLNKLKLDIDNETR